MTQKRRDFLKAMSAVAVANGAIGRGFNPEALFGGIAKPAAPSVGDPLFRELAMTALDIRGGKIVGMLKDVAYQVRTPEFWNAMDMIGGKRDYKLGGTFNDGKGQPSQSNAVSHGCSTTRHKQISVINTGRTG